MRILAALVALCLAGACSSEASETADDDPNGITQEPFGTVPGQGEATLYTLTNSSGASIEITNFGAIIRAVHVPDRNGELGDIALGYDTLEQYIAPNPMFGAVVGRVANRIGNARFTLDGVEYQLDANDGRNTLHGGADSVNKKLWDAQPLEIGGAPALRLTLTSPDGENGFPGTVEMAVTYIWTEENDLIVRYEAETDKPTVLSMTQHSYFNLDGHDQGTILDHELKIPADFYLEMDEERISTGEITAVEGTPFDFREGKVIGVDIDASHPLVQMQRGFALHMLFDRRKVDTDGLHLAGSLYAPESGRQMCLWTQETGMQIYTGVALDEDGVKGGGSYVPYSGMPFEPHGYPNAPNLPHVPSIRLDPGERYDTTTRYRFTAGGSMAECQ